jgi:hypothetical protein
MSRELLERNYSFWTDSRLEAGFKDFIFRLVHGKLYLNYQRANFEDVRRGCTFCEMVRHRELVGRGLNVEDIEYQVEIERVPREDMTHLFWECDKSSTLVNGVVQSLIGHQMRGGAVLNKQKFMGGWEGATKGETNVNLLVVHFLKYFIFKCKQRKRFPLIIHALEELGVTVDYLKRMSKWREPLENMAVTLVEIIEDV